MSCLQGVPMQLESFHDLRGTKGIASTPKSHLTFCPSFYEYDLFSKGPLGFWRPS